MKTFYHGTAARYKDSILTKGLIPGYGHGADAWAQKKDLFTFLEISMAPTHQSPSVFMAANIVEARWFASLAVEANGDSSAVIFKVQLPETMARKLVKDRADHLAVQYMGTIPAKYISVAEVIQHPSRAKLAADAQRIRDEETN